MNVSAIVPAFDEAGRIGAVLKALCAAASVSEVVVVDDGSADRTAEEAGEHPIRLVCLAENRGKAAALDAGVRAAKGEVLLFLDADLTGLKPEHVDGLVQAYLNGDADVVIGVFREGRMGTDFSQRIVPFLSGQRVLHRRLWEVAQRSVDDLDFGVEVALTKLALREGWRQKRIVMDGVSHVRKEEKRGLYMGMLDRMRMYADIMRSLVRKL